MQQIRMQEKELSVELPPAEAAALPPQARLERGFWLALALAILLHLPLLAGLARTVQPSTVGGKIVGEETVDVDLIDAAALAGLQAPPTAPASPPSPPVEAQPPAAPAPAERPAPPPEPLARSAERTPPAAAEVARDTDTAPPEPAVEKAEQGPALRKSEAPDEKRPAERASKPTEELDLTQLLKPQIPATPPPAKKERSKEKEKTRDKEGEKPRERQKVASAEPTPARPQLDLRLPAQQGSFSLPGGRETSVTRPPGTSRTPENDDFARGVIAALRRTMPEPRGRLGRVTIRLVLNEIGNFQSVELVASSGNVSLDQDVQFAARQSSFPIPPRGATVVDRTFLITYIYRQY